MSEDEKKKRILDMGCSIAKQFQEEAIKEMMEDFDPMEEYYKIQQQED